MALVHGKDGFVVVNGTDYEEIILNVQRWSLTVNHNIVETTSMGDDWKTYLTGLQDWGAVVECLANSDSMEPGFDTNGLGHKEVSLQLYLTPAGEGIYGLVGDAICTGAMIGSNLDNAATVVYTFQGVDQMQWS